MNIKLVELYGLQSWNNVLRKWEDLNASNESAVVTSLGPKTENSIVLYDAGSGPGLNPVNPLKQSLDWKRFDVNDGGAITGGWNIFESPGVTVGVISQDAVSVKIRYSLRVTDMNTPAGVYVSQEMYYQVINASHPKDHIAFSSGSTTGPWAPTVSVTLPGISNAMVKDSEALFSWLASPLHWQAELKMPSGDTRRYSPTANPTIKTADSDEPTLDGAMAIVEFRLPMLQVSQSGQYTLTVSLLPNAQGSGGFHKFADAYTWTSTITAMSPSMSDPLYLSFETNTFMVIEFAQEIV